MYIRDMAKLGDAERNAALECLRGEYGRYRAQNHQIDMQRGRPCAEQLALASQMLDWGDAPFLCEDGVDARNYGGGIEGTPEARRLFAELFGVAPANVIVRDNSSLNIMYDCLVKALLFGVGGGKKPWLAQAAESGERCKFLCPVPGYDRHFRITERLGFEMINVAMGPDGPDMDAVERLVESDAMIKGIWNVPKNSNPTGITYSDAVVGRFARLRPKADDFRIFWDNSYAVHDLYDEPNELPDLYGEAQKQGNADLVYMFSSTSKITFAGSGITAFASSEANVRYFAEQMSVQTICPDKLNQLRHVRYIRDMDNLRAIMARHAAIVRPKFERVLAVLAEEFRGAGAHVTAGANPGDGDICAWNSPRGGYFISLDAPEGCAAKALRLAADAGIKFTPAGATYPYGKDPYDRNIRIAPTVPSLGELETAARILALCVKIAYLERTVC